MSHFDQCNMHVTMFWHVHLSLLNSRFSEGYPIRHLNGIFSYLLTFFLFPFNFVCDFTQLSVNWHFLKITVPFLTNADFLVWGFLQGNPKKLNQEKKTGKITMAKSDVYFALPYSPALVNFINSEIWISNVINDSIFWTSGAGCGMNDLYVHSQLNMLR